MPNPSFEELSTPSACSVNVSYKPASSFASVSRRKRSRLVSSPLRSASRIVACSSSVMFFIVSPSGRKSFAVPKYEEARLTHTDLDDSRIARQGFGRGLCVIDDHRIAAGSSPSTIAVHDLATLKTTQMVTLTYDVRNAIHGLEVWPFDSPW